MSLPCHCASLSITACHCPSLPRHFFVTPPVPLLCETCAKSPLIRGLNHITLLENMISSTKCLSPNPHQKTSSTNQISRRKEVFISTPLLAHQRPIVACQFSSLPVNVCHRPITVLIITLSPSHCIPHRPVTASSLRKKTA